MGDSILSILADLVGESARYGTEFADAAQQHFTRTGLGYSQLNELLLLLGHDRVTPSFFQFLVDGSTECQENAVIKSIEEFRRGVDRFRKVAILNFGNVKFGFKYLSDPRTDLTEELAGTAALGPEHFTSRHEALLPVEPIAGDKTYYLGYLVEREINDRLGKDPGDEQAKEQLRIRKEIVGKGRRNQKAYLASDHMDVYVATSMRERHEFQIVNQVVREVFGDAALKDLRLRVFDPTQAYCEDRIDKGLAEALMLKRAACTLYLAQESDTLGKDSELASTLAQGKPVIAYIPRVLKEDEEDYAKRLLAMLAETSPGSDEGQLLLGQLRAFSPALAWADTQVKQWVADPQSMGLEAARKRLGEEIRKQYDKRAETLKELHPLGIQVNLQTGVANGVLVARTTCECADLIRRILTRNLQFRIEEKTQAGNRYLLLREESTGSIFRVVTGDHFLTNAFWNFYLAK
jgi:hypothetical protein